jgi:hypothetical protein
MTGPAARQLRDREQSRKQEEEKTIAVPACDWARLISLYNLCSSTIDLPDCWIRVVETEDTARSPTFQKQDVSLPAQ